MNSNLNYKCTLLKGVVVFDEPEEVLKCYEEYKKSVRYGTTCDDHSIYRKNEG